MAIQVLIKCCWMCPLCGLSGEVQLPDPNEHWVRTFERAYADHESKIETCVVNPLDIVCWLEVLPINADQIRLSEG